MDDLRGLWLVFDATMKATLDDTQFDQTINRVAPVALSDGRFAICADLLSEISESGLFHTAFARLDPRKFAAVEVIANDAFLQLLPSSQES